MGTPVGRESGADYLDDTFRTKCGRRVRRRKRWAMQRDKTRAASTPARAAEAESQSRTGLQHAYRSNHRRRRSEATTDEAMRKGRGANRPQTWVHRWRTIRVIVHEVPGVVLRWVDQTRNEMMRQRRPSQPHFPAQTDPITLVPQSLRAARARRRYDCSAAAARRSGARPRTPPSSHLASSALAPLTLIELEPPGLVSMVVVRRATTRSGRD